MMLPFMSMRAPPEFPGLSEASVCRALYVVFDEPVSPLNCSPPYSKGQLPPPCCCCCPWPWSWSAETVTSRSSAEMMPLVTVPVRPSGEPIATTSSPILTLSELPRLAALSPEASLSLISARSFLLSVPTTSASYVFPSFVVTLTDEAPEITWLFVMISPSPVMITPEPVAWPEPDCALISTMLGLTASATPETVPFWLVGTTFVLVALLDVPSLPVSSWKAYAVPPPTAAAAMATAASRAMGPLARRREGFGGCPGVGASGAKAGGGGYAPCVPPW